MNSALQAIIILGCLITSPVFAGEVISVQGLSFGSIDLHPGGDTIRIDAADGSTQPDGDRSVVTGGGSGRIRLSSEILENVDIHYPESTSLYYGENEITVTDLAAYSQYGDTGLELPGDGATVDIHIGGKLSLDKTTEYGNYSGNMTVQLDFF